MATTSATPPLIKAPTAKEKKYDRQLRLWAVSGQQALEESHVLLIIPNQGGNGSGSSVAGVETLKNLVLPGIGSFTIADSAKVMEADLGINFFLGEKSLGNSRAEECRDLLMELNPDVEGHVITLALDGWPENIDDLKRYNLIILCEPFPLRLRRRTCHYAQAHMIPVISINSVGFYSTFSVQLPSEFPIVDTHPDPETTQDLRLLSPWPELSAAAKALGDLATLNNDDHGHVPYILLLLHHLEEWRASHSGKNPQTYREKTQFRELLRARARTDNPEGGEENYDEAISAVLKSVKPPEMGSGCREMFDMPSCTNLTAESASFWLIASAVRTFYHKHGVLPLPGSLPDMKARSSDYIALQNIYKSKARKDVAEVVETIRVLEQQLKRSVPVLESEIEALCKNASHIKIIKGSFMPEVELDDKAAATIASYLQDESSLLPIWLSLSTSARHPSLLLSNSFKLSENVLEGLEDVNQEVLRAKGGELHNISSVTGGMVAQEAIKIITRQYVPVDNTCIYDGIRGGMQVVKL